MAYELHYFNVGRAVVCQYLTNYGFVKDYVFYQREPWKVLDLNMSPVDIE